MNRAGRLGELFPKIDGYRFDAAEEDAAQAIPGLASGAIDETLLISLPPDHDSQRSPPRKTAIVSYRRNLVEQKGFEARESRETFAFSGDPRLKDQ